MIPVSLRRFLEGFKAYNIVIPSVVMIPVSLRRLPHFAGHDTALTFSRHDSSELEAGMQATLGGCFVVLLQSS